MARIFISHSSQDNAAAMAVSQWLGEHGWDDLFLDLDPERGLKAGERWQESLKHAAERCQLVLFLISPAWHESKWCVAEFLLAKQMNKRIAAAIIEPVDLGDLPGELTAEWQLVDLTAGDCDYVAKVKPPPGNKSITVKFSTDGLMRLRIGLAEAGLDARYFAWPPADDPDRSPYRGLKALEAEDAGIFFGRDGPIVLGMDAMRGLREAAAPRLMAILGASGAGKSSFMRAGLLPRLKREDRHFLPLPPVRPERAALSGEEGLIAVLEQALKDTGEGATRAEVRKAVEAGANAVGALLARVAAKTRLDDPIPTLVLPVDQGEELFAADGAEEAGRFLTLMRGLMDDETVPLIVLFTIRSESFEALQSAPALEGVRRVAFDLPPMPRGSFSEVIIGPARRLDGTNRALKIEEPLVDALLADADKGGAKDALPLLAFTLERLYREHGGDGDLKLAEYEDLGGVRGSIEAAVTQAMKAADGIGDIPRGDAERLALLRRGMIPWLAGIDPDTGAPRRRIARMSEIPEDARALMQLLVDQRLLATDVAKDTGEVTIEPAHEALLRQWGLLQAWLDEDAETLGALEGVRRATREWEANGRDGAWLAHSGGRLEAAEAACARADMASLLGDAERDYLAEARKAENARRDAETNRLKKERRLYRLITGGSLAATIIMGIGAWQMYGLWQSTFAEKLFWEAFLATANGENEKAAKLFAEARARGHERAALIEATLSSGGVGLEQDSAKAAKLYEIAAEQGDGIAMMSIAEIYQNGNGVEQDYGKAREWYLKAAEAGNGEAWSKLGYMTLEGQGADPDPEKARGYYEKGVAAGVASALNDLGWIYRNGLGVEADEARAQDYFRQAAEKGLALAMANLGDGYFNGISGAPDYGKALEWFRKASEKGSDFADSRLGWMYQNGLGVETDLTKALEFYLRAANQGNAEATNSVGFFNENGMVVPQDFDRARTLYEKAVEAGSASAMANLASMLYDGRGGEKNLKRAAELLHMSAEHGNTVALNSLGWIYEHGEGVDQDYAAALGWYRKAADAGVAQAMFNLGRLYENGIGVGKNTEIAGDWYAKAAGHGHEEAARQLKALKSEASATNG